MFSCLVSVYLFGLKELFRIVASLGASLLAETLQQRVLANARMSLAGLVLIEKNGYFVSLLQGKQYEYENLS